MRSLRSCFDRHGCDRGSLRHHYDVVYQDLEPPARMLEVGILHGAGIASWLEWFPEAEIVGLDTFERVHENKVAILKDPRVTWWKGDSRTLTKIPGPFDLIIDDGDHSADAQRETFINLFPLLSPGGVYFIEDAHPGRPGWEDLLDTLMGFHVEHHDLRGHPDSYLIEVRC